MLNQEQVEGELVRLSQECEKAMHHLARCAEDSARADAQYKKAHAQAFLTAKGKTVADREALAAIETADEYEHRRIAEAFLLAAQEKGRSYRAQLEALRSVNANLRDLVVGA